VKSQCIAGSDYDSLRTAEMSDDGFVLTIHAQSDDGDFAGSGSGGYPVQWLFTVNDDLSITGKEKESGLKFPGERIGEKDGVPVYPSAAFLKGFDAGSPSIFLNYGHFYLIVSENITGIYKTSRRRSAASGITGKPFIPLTMQTAKLFSEQPSIRLPTTMRGRTTGIDRTRTAQDIPRKIPFCLPLSKGLFNTSIKLIFQKELET
jgi:hypothetical protein